MSLINFAKGLKVLAPLLFITSKVFSAKNASYAIAIPTNNSKTAEIVLNSELSTFSPTFYPSCTPKIEPQINIITRTRSIEP